MAGAVLHTRSRGVRLRDFLGPFDRDAAARLASFYPMLIVNGALPPLALILVRDTLAVTTVVRTSATIVTITLPAIPLYAITADEVITVTVPAVAVALAAEIVATPTITIHEGAVLSAYSGTTNGSGVLATNLTSDQAGVRVLTRAYIGSTEVGRITTLPT